MHFSSSPWVTKRWGPCFLSRLGSLSHQREGSVSVGLCPYRCAGRLESPGSPRLCEHIWSSGQPQGRPRTCLTAPHPFCVCARHRAGVGRMYVSIAFGDPTPTTPGCPWA